MKTRVFTGTTNPDIQPYELAHRQVARTAAAESIVLLKNEGEVLPVSTDMPIALYGAGASHTIKGGTGSGDVNERYSVTIAEGLREAGYRLTTEDWLEAYDRQFTAAREQWRDEIWAKADACQEGSMALFDIYASTPFTYPAGPLSVEKTETDVAVYVLSRIAGEGADRFDTEGDYYLSKEETELIGNICAVYPKVVLVINTGGPVDLSFTDAYANIAAILQISQLGCEGGNGFADVFSGKVPPSGKLTDSWAYRYEDYPNSAAYSHNNGNVEQEFYGEGIYVGYRYFDTFEVPVRYGFGFGLGYTDFALRTVDISVSGKEDKKPEKKPDKMPETKPEARSEKKPEIAVTVSVTNRGMREGRETVQVYVSCPQEKLVKEYRRLVGFAKTKTLQPGENEEVTVCFTPYEMASYCEKTPGWVLEKGIYGIFAGNSLQAATLAGTIQIESDQILVKTENICPLQESLEELAGSVEKVRARRAAWLEEVCVRRASWQEQADKAGAGTGTGALPRVVLNGEDLVTEAVIYGKDTERISKEVKDFVDTLSEEQLILLATGDPGQGQDATVGSAGISVPGSAAQSSGCAREQGLADLVFADGPAGLRLNKKYLVKDGMAVKESFLEAIEGGYLCRDKDEQAGQEKLKNQAGQETPEVPAESSATEISVEPETTEVSEISEVPEAAKVAEASEIMGSSEEKEYFQYCTAFPVGTALAQTWDLACVAEVGRAVAEEMQMLLVTSWLAPGMNIHRNPLCGRNFEYYSEDPFLSGKIAAAMTDGVQFEKGCGTTIKHFACNNQEDNRKGSDSILSERALREIYLKGFEIAIRESQPMMIMTSYNKINGVHAANSYDLCTKAARDEWEFKGFIMTDWTTTHDGPDCTAAGCMRAGNDMVMPGRAEDHENIRQALAEGTLLIEELKACICHLVNIIWQSNMYE